MISIGQTSFKDEIINMQTILDYSYILLLRDYQSMISIMKYLINTKRLRSNLCNQKIAKL